jgi:hypothetical protein
MGGVRTDGAGFPEPEGIGRGGQDPRLCNKITDVCITSKQCSVGERDIGAADLFAMSRNELERRQHANIVNHSLVAACNTAILADGAKRKRWL